jgi:hypothetical protein
MRQLCLSALLLFLSFSFSLGQGFLNSFSATGTGGVDNNGQIYLVDGPSNNIRVLDGNGSFLFQFGSSGAGDGQFSTPVAIAIDQSNNVFVVDRDNYRIQKFDNAGNFIVKFGGTGGVDATFANPPGYISVDNSGNIYVIETDNSSFSGVRKYDNNGNYLSTIGSYGYFPLPQRIAIDGANNLYVYDGTNQDVSRFDQFGNFDTNFFLGQGNAFATGKFGSFFFGDLSEVINEFDNTGTPIGNWGSNGGGNGLFFSIYDMFTNAARDRLYVYDDIAGDIEVYDITRTPPTQASSILFFNVTSSSLDIGWTNGDGDNRILVGNQGFPPTAPTDNSVYTPNSAFGFGDDVGGGSYVLYQGNGNSASITNLAPNTLYYFHVFESHGAGTTIKYQTAGAFDNPLTQTTSPSVSTPTIQATNIGFGAPTSTSIDVFWTNGDGSRRIVVASTGNVSGVPADNTTYSANGNFGNGSQLNPGEYVVYDGTETNVNVTGLSPSTTYEFRIFEYNGNPGAELYLTTTDSGNPNSILTDPPPCIADAGIGNTVNSCNDSSQDLFSQLLGAPDAGGTWTQLSGPGSPTITGDQVDLNAAPGGSYDFEYRVTESSCPDVTAIVTVNVTQQLFPGVGNSASVCNTDAAFFLTGALGGSPDTGGTWSQMSGPSAVTITGDNADFIGAKGGSHNFEYSIGGGVCAVLTSNLIVTVSEQPDAGIANTVAGCNNDPGFYLFGSLSGIPTPGGVWIQLGGTSAITITGDYADFISAIPDTYVFEYSVTGSGPCTNASAQLTVNVGADLDAGENGNLNACSPLGVIGLASVLTGTPDTGGIWTQQAGPPISLIGDQADFSSELSGIYVFEYTVNGCAGPDLAQVTVNLNEPPSVNAGSDFEACETVGASPLVAIAANYASVFWTHNGTGSLDDPTSLIPTYTYGAGETGIVTFTATAFGNPGCSNMADNVDLTITALPFVNAGGNNTICEGGNWNIVDATASNYLNVAWSTSGTGSFSDPTALTTTYFPGIGETGIITLTLDVASTGTCTSVQDTKQLTIDALPTMANAGGDQNICGTATVLGGNTPSTGFGTWSIVSGASGNIANAPDPTSPFNGIQGNTYVLRWTIANGTCSASFDDVTISFDQNPTVANAGTDIAQCNNGNFTLAGNTPLTGTGTWAVMAGSATITTPTSPTSGITGVPVGTSATLRWTITNGGCTPSFDDIILTNENLPTVANAGGDQNICGTATVLAGNAPAVGFGTWSIVSGTGGNIANSPDPTSPFNGNQGEIYLLRWTITNGTCTASFDDVTIDLNQNPTISNAGTDFNQCNDGSFTLAGNTPVTGLGTWSVISGTATITTPGLATSGVTGVPAGTAATLRWTIVNGVCAASTDDVVITNEAAPTTANAGTDIDQCNSGNFTLAGNSPVVGTGVWSVVSGTAAITSPVSPTSSVTGVPAGTSATLRWTISNGTCTSSTDDVILTNSATPTTANAGTDINQCNNANFTLAGNSPVTGTGTWSVFSGTATITTPTSSTSGVTGVPVGISATLRWTITNGACAASIDDVVITNEATPTTANAGTDISQCNNGSFTLAGNSPVTGTGTWSVIIGTATITTPTSATSGITGVPVGTSATLRWTIANGTCTPSFDDVLLTNDNVGTVVNPGNQTVCQGANTSTITFTGSATTYNWTNDNPSIGLAASGSGNIASFTTTSSGIATITVTPDNAGCAGTPEIFTITVNAVGIVANPGNQTVCDGSNTSAITFTGTATTYNWLNDNPSIGLAASGSGDIGSFTATGSGVATITVAPDNAGCVGTSEIFTITVNPSGTVANPGNQTICQGANTSAITFTGTATTYNWMNDNPSIGLAASGSGDIVSFTTIGSGTATITITPDNGGCTGTPQIFTITVNSLGTVANPGNQAVCVGGNTSTITFIGSATIYNWTNDNSAIGLSASGSGDIASFVTTGSGLATITVTPDNAGCAGTPEIFTITVSPSGTVVNPGNQTVCEEANTSAITFIGTATAYNWINDNPSIGLAANGSGDIISFTTTGFGTATITVTPDNSGCLGAPEMFTITANASGAVVNPGSQSVCEEVNTSAITFTGTATTYNWTNDNSSIGLAASGSGDITSFAPAALSTATITVTPDNAGCAGAPEIFTISVNEVPNVLINNLTPTIPSGGATNILLTSDVAGALFNFSIIAPPEVGGGKGGSASSITQVLTNSSADDQTVTFQITPSTPQCVGAMQSVDVLVLGNSNLPTVIPADSLALVALYQFARGAFWTKHWLNGKVNTWQGVTVESMRVTMLDLSANNLSGTLPAEMIQLDGLLELNLSNNEIGGEIILPSTLIILEVSDNNFTDWSAVPPQLAVINVSSNRIASLPDLLSNPITSLNVTNNDLTFDDIEPLLGVTGFSYIPQNKVEDVIDILVETGTEQTFAAAVTGDSYQWYKNDVPIDTALSSAITLSDIQIADDAEYHYTVTSATVPGLTLERSDILLKVSSLSRDSIALRQFYIDTEGASWANSTNWIVTSLRTGNWNGVVIANSRVVGLNLPNNNISGGAMTLKDIGNLQNVDLSSNSITGLPDLTGLTLLQTFNISDNNLQFNSLEMNVGITGINYTDQKNVGTGSYTEVHSGGTHAVGIGVLGTANQYQWRRDGVLVEEAVNDTYAISVLSRLNMGIYDCEITNSLVPGLTLTSRPDTVYAVANISGSVAINEDAMLNGIVTLFKVTDIGGYDTTRTYELVDGSYMFSNVVLADYQVHVLPDADNYPDALPTYYTNTIFWEEALIVELNEDMEGIDIDVESLTPPVPEGVGILRGYLEEDDGTSGGRVKTPKRVGGAGVALRRGEGSGRGKETLVLVDYVITNEEGEFEFTQLKEATYNLNIQYPGYPMDETSDIEVYVGSGLESEITVGASVEEGMIVVRKFIVTGTLENYGVEAYPNPANEYLIMKFPSENISRTVTMYSLSGKQTLKSGAPDPTTRIDLKNVASGSYVIYVSENGRMIKTHHILIE